MVFIKALFGYSYVCHFLKKKKKKSFLYSLLWQGLISSVMYSSHRLCTSHVHNVMLLNGKNGSDG